MEARMQFGFDGFQFPQPETGTGFMQTVEVVLSDVIVKLTENRQKHIDTYTDAKANYRAKVVEALQARAAEIEGGADIVLWFQLPEPEDHTDDYNEAIAALQWDQRDKVELSRDEFRQYVLDKWRWEQSFAANTQSYASIR